MSFERENNLHFSIETADGKDLSIPLESNGIGKNRPELRFTQNSKSTRRWQLNEQWKKPIIEGIKKREKKLGQTKVLVSYDLGTIARFKSELETELGVLFLFLFLFRSVPSFGYGHGSQETQE